MKKIFVICVALALLVYGFSDVVVHAEENSVTPIDIYYGNTNLNCEWKVSRMSVYYLTNKILTTQNFSRYGSTDTFFITQHDGADTYLIRCTLSSGILTAQDFCILPGYGHGESVEVTGYNSATSTYTVWIGSDYNVSSGNYYWSKNISRVNYTVTGNDQASTTRVEISNILGAINESGSSNRSAVCVAENDNRICLCTQKNNDDGNWFYIVYALSDLNAALNQLQSGASCSLSSLNLTIKSAFSLTDTSLPNGSFQAIDNDGVGANNKFLFIAGGSSNNNAKIDQYLYTNGGNINKVNQYIFHTTEVPDNLPESDEQAFLKNAEIEGIKIYTVNGTDYMFIMFREQGSSKRARIFSYPVSSNN